MGRLSDVNIPRGRMHLGVTLQAQIVVPLNQHLVIGRTMGLMANRTAFPQGLVFIHHQAGLLSMAGRASIVSSTQAQATFGFKKIETVRIVALNATHPPLGYRMMLRQFEFRLLFQMTIEASLGLFARIDDKFSSATTALHMQTARPMTRFATNPTRHLGVDHAQPGVRAGSKGAGIIRVAVLAGFVAHEGGSFYFREGQSARRGCG